MLQIRESCASSADADADADVDADVDAHVDADACNASSSHLHLTHVTHDSRKIVTAFL